MTLMIIEQQNWIINQMDTLLEIITTSAITGFFASVLTTILTIKFTRKNIKTTKYIETITTKRIKWIENIRNDFSILITSLLILKNNKEKFHDIEFESERLSYVRHLTMRDKFEDNELKANYDTSKLINDIKVAFGKCLTPSEIVIKATQLKLRLNLDQDKEICDILDTIISEYSMIDFDFSNSKIELIQLSNLAQKMLTKYWNDIIDEVNNK